MKIDAIKGSMLRYKTGMKKDTVSNSNDVCKKLQTASYSLPHGMFTNPVSFNGTANTTDMRIMHDMKNYFTPETQKIYSGAKYIAQKTGARELETKHLYLASLITVKKYLNDLDSGIIKYEEEGRLKLPYIIESTIAPNNRSMANEKSRAKVKKVINKHIKSVEKSLMESPKSDMTKILSVQRPSKNMIEDLREVYDAASRQANIDGFYDSYLFLTALNSQDQNLAKEADSLVTDLQKTLMTDDVSRKEKNHLSFYDDKANDIWKNISYGNDVIFLYNSEDSASSRHLISSFVNLINKPGQNYKNIDPEKINIITLNKFATFEYLNNLVRDIKTGKEGNDQTTIIVGDLFDLLKNNDGQLALEDLKILANTQGKNKVHFVFGINKESYYANTAKGGHLAEPLKNYAVQMLPSLNAEDTSEYLTNESGMEFVKKAAKKTCSKEAVQRAIEISDLEDGNYPDKAVTLLSAVSKFFIDKNYITADDVEIYARETKNLSEIQGKNQSNIVFNTGKNLSDIVGSPMTKADAESIVRQIKNRTIGTKGFRAYLENGSSYGGGRRHTAEAIAGEAGIPMITVNAKDFALKDIDALSQNADLSEIKIKNIVSTAKAQAKSNKNKAAMIFIENFDNFAADSLYGISSIYEQKAFTQLLTEMEDARKNDNINLIVVGSVNRPEIIDENIMKPYKFLNSIIVYPPQDAQERESVFDYYINRMDLKIKGDGEKEKAKIIRNIAETTSGFTVVDIMYLLETANNVSKERGKDKIDESDLTEAYLQTVSGRTNTARIPEERKKIVTSHETGHALTLQIMYEIAENEQTPWHLPDKVNFITLDPRGNFGGAMFSKSSDNQELNFETIMSNIVCDYGGHSAEKTIYNMSGSWGITADMENAEQTAELAVMNMGIGPRTGVCCIARNALGQADVSEAKKAKIEADIESFEKAGLQISDMIVEAYKDFIVQFTEEHYRRVGTGECIISAEEFTKELNEWRNGLDIEKKESLKQLNHNICAIMENAKKGKM